MTSILHFSDIHFPLRLNKMTMREMLRFKRVLAGVNYALRRRKKFEDGDRKWAAFLRYVQERGDEFDALVCTGDYTALGMRKELRHAREQLKPLLQHPGLVLLPGNHDVYLPEAGGGYFYEVFGDAIRSEYSRIRPSDAPAGYPFVQLVDEQVAVLAVNSARSNPAFWRSSGVVDAQSVRAMRELLEREEVRRRKVVVATHYNVDDEDSALHGLNDRRAFRDLLAKYDCALLLHGHVHRGRKVDIAEFSVPVYCAGSLTYAGRESFWEFRIGERFEARQFHWTGSAYQIQTRE